MKAWAGVSVLALLGGAPLVDAFDYKIADPGSILLIDAATGITGMLLVLCDCIEVHC